MVELFCISAIVAAIYFPYAQSLRKEEEKLAAQERELQKAYGASPWASSGSYTQAETLIEPNGSDWFSFSEPPPEPVSEPLFEPPEPLTEPAEPFAEPPAEPPAEPVQMVNFLAKRNEPDWTPANPKVLISLIKDGEFESLEYPVDLVDHPKLKSLIELILILRSLKESGVSLNVTCQQLQISKGGSKPYQLVNLIWNTL